MKKILITGADSYIGTSFENYMKQWPDKYEINTIDTRGLKASVAMFDSYDVIFHVAGIAHIKETQDNQKLYFMVNRDLTIEIAKKAKSAGVRQFVALSTMSVYGKTIGHITRETEMVPVNAYGKSKCEADCVLMEEISEHFKVAILRPPMVYGKGCKGNYQTLRKFATTMPIFPNYRNERSMIYIGNLCEFVKKVVDEEKSGLFFPQNKEYVCTSEMAKLIASINGKKQLQIKIFNPFIKILPVGVLKKIFGNLTYEKIDTVEKFGFKESIELSERNDGK